MLEGLGIDAESRGQQEHLIGLVQNLHAEGGQGGLALLGHLSKAVEQTGTGIQDVLALLPRQI